MSNANEYTIVVNGRQKTVQQHKLTYEEVVKLAFPDAQFTETTAYTVGWTDPNGHRDGAMVSGDFIPLKNGMVFNVANTDKS